MTRRLRALTVFISTLVLVLVLSAGTAFAAHTPGEDGGWRGEPDAKGCPPPAAVHAAAFVGDVGQGGNAAHSEPKQGDRGC